MLLVDEGFDGSIMAYLNIISVIYTSISMDNLFYWNFSIFQQTQTFEEVLIPVKSNVRKSLNHDK